jgi:hypothetical protein
VRERAFDVSRRNFLNRNLLNLADADWARNRPFGSRFNQSNHVRDRKSEVLQGWLVMVGVCADWMQT